jgi:hypothetical protein
MCRLLTNQELELIARNSPEDISEIASSQSLSAIKTHGGCCASEFCSYSTGRAILSRDSLRIIDEE